ncbi:hypothetical protein VYU27_007829 [Nannochloropsis oceanica]
MDATRSLEDAQRTMRLNEKTTALLLTGRRPDAPPYLGPGASESSSEATYLSLLCDLEEAKKKGRKGCGTDMTTTHTVPPSHIAGLLRQEIARQKNLIAQDAARFQSFQASLFYTQQIYEHGLKKVEKCATSKVYNKEMNGMLKDTIRRTLEGLRAGGEGGEIGGGGGGEGGEGGGEGEEGGGVNEEGGEDS